MSIRNLLSLADAYCRRTALSHWQVGLRAAGSAKFFRDLREGTRKGCTITTYDRAIQYLSDHWPSDLDWPPEIPRPAPNPGRGEAA